MRAVSLVRSLGSLAARDVALAGGKGANLGELVRAGFPVPDGFALTTEAYEIASRAAGVDHADPQVAAERLRGAPVPAPIADAARQAYRDLGGGRVAVRSSATAEDLPGASFAGQQDTFLDVAGEDALLDAIRRSWASLFNDRAVAYRRANGIDEASVALAVVVQRMVDAAAAGVLFTADPVTGERRRTAIDAIAGLGDALVSGRVNPDHYVVRSGAIVDRRGRVLDDASILALAATGERVERHFAAPQDIEFAFDRSGALWLLQSRPITTLYPLPVGAPDPDRDLRVYFSANVAQGMFEPFTPMGVQTFRLISASFAAALRRPVRDPVAGAPVLVVAGMRIFADVTALVRNPVGRRIAGAALGVMEARTAIAMRRLEHDPRLAIRGSTRATIPIVVPAIARTGIPWIVLRALARPDATRQRTLREIDADLRRAAAVAPATAAERIDAFERMFLDLPRRLFPKLVGLVAAGALAYNLSVRLLRGRATTDELRTILRALPHNPTTEMDLALWALARDAREDRRSAAAVRDESPEALAERYRAVTLPPWLQQHLVRFLERYGHRAIGEIDLGVPRWSEDPAHLLGAISNYLRLSDEAQSPDAQFARGARDAEAMVDTLLARVHGPRRLVARALLRRMRSLFGLREQPKFQIIRLFAIGRALLAPVGEELAQGGRIAAPDDIWFLTLPEIRRGLAGEDQRATVEQRRGEYRRELARRRIPRLLLSDGTDVEALGAGAAAAGALVGTAAAPGIASGSARVIHSPQGARIDPGEILVAPSTDPGWTPLFLTAGGLVMEMGGMMSHGAVVAREYGIPAVVGVAAATERIATGRRITVDGSAGTVSLDGEDHA
ncbi:MAG TPA: PEP/pyruvate-binding domain-containing protein [Candidatus Dormibacteraeota bacterium]|nr:PEP/pyruvate-binding domain-containing protein [Candidatus Dormibacteraeota bacterium]